MLTRLSDLFSSIDDLELAILIGSRATGAPGPDSDWDIADLYQAETALIAQEQSALSDIDIAVLTRNSDKKNGAALKFSLYADLCRKLNRNDIDLVLLNLSGNLILNDEIVRHGKVLYTSDDEARENFELNVLHSYIDFKFQRQIKRSS